MGSTSTMGTLAHAPPWALKKRTKGAVLEATREGAMFAVQSTTSTLGTTSTLATHFASPGSRWQLPQKPMLVTGAGSTRERRLVYSCPGRAVRPPCVMLVPRYIAGAWEAFQEVSGVSEAPEGTPICMLSTLL